MSILDPLELLTPEEVALLGHLSVVPWASTVVVTRISQRIYPGIATRSGFRAVVAGALKELGSCPFYASGAHECCRGRVCSASAPAWDWIGIQVWYTDPDYLTVILAKEAALPAEPEARREALRVLGAHIHLLIGQVYAS